MGCFPRLLRCIMAPFSNKEPQAIEIGHPTNFRKEELPACFSDAESVLSPNHSTSERPILTTDPQYVEVADKRKSHDGEERNDSRDGGYPTIPHVENSEPSSQDELEPKPKSEAEPEPETAIVRLRKRERLIKWLRPASDEP